MKAPMPYHKNVPGPFYVEDQMCIACGAPAVEAPDLIGGLDDDSENHCYVKKQPESGDEVTAMLAAVAASCVGCIRYRGNDSEVLRRMAELGAAENCDVDLPE